MSNKEFLKRLSVIRKLLEVLLGKIVTLFYFYFFIKISQTLQ